MNINRVEGSSVKSDTTMCVLGNPVYKLFFKIVKKKRFLPNHLSSYREGSTLCSQAPEY